MIDDLLYMATGFVVGLPFGVFANSLIDDIKKSRGHCSELPPRPEQTKSYSELADEIIKRHERVALKFKANEEKALSDKRRANFHATGFLEPELNTNTLGPINTEWYDDRYMFKEIIKPAHGGLGGVRVRMRCRVRKTPTLSECPKAFLAERDWHEIAHYDKVKGWIYR